MLATVLAPPIAASSTRNWRRLSDRYGFSRTDRIGSSAGSADASDKGEVPIVPGPGWLKTSWMAPPNMRRQPTADKRRTVAPAPPTREDVARIAAIFARFAAASPTPVTELHYADPFTFLVAVALSAQATDASVNKATPALFARAPDPAAMVALGVDGVREAIRSIGLFNTKAKNVVALSEALLRDHGGEVPQSREALQRLPGVGSKTAAVVVNNLWGEPAIAVDTHVFRVSNRLPVAPGKTPEAVEAGLVRMVPRRLQAPRPPLADPAWPLHLHGAAAEVRGLSGA